MYRACIESPDKKDFACIEKPFTLEMLVDTPEFFHSCPMKSLYSQQDSFFLVAAKMMYPALLSQNAF